MNEVNVAAPPNGPTSKARYVMIGGFLGAGKTTAVAKLGHYLSSRGVRVGLITNDQGQDLVDTAMLKAQGFATQEIPGGCFCCRFNSLVEAAAKLTEQSRPEVIIAEPVGSCTDLVATVTYPLRRLYGENFTVAPVSVLVDPIRAMRIFGLEAGNSFSEKVLYIYRKQLEEADLVVVSKSDLLSPERLAALHRTINSRFPGKEILAVSPRHGTNLNEWFARLEKDEQRARAAMAVDYEIYADGEAKLGWLNCTVELHSENNFDSERFLTGLAVAVQKELQSCFVEIAHLKMTLNPDRKLGELAVVNLVRNDFVPELSMRLEDPIRSGQLTINLRAEAEPALLGQAVRNGLDIATREFPGLRATLEHLEQFKPGKPKPTYRFELATQ